MSILQSGLTRRVLEEKLEDTTIGNQKPEIGEGEKI
jgi:hypothetical protein